MIKSIKKKADVKFATDKQSILDENFRTESTKVRISMFIDGALLKEIKKQASKSGAKYQTLMQSVLHDYFLKQEDGKFEFASKKDLEEIRSRLFLVEKFVKQSRQV